MIDHRKVPTFTKKYDIRVKYSIVMNIYVYFQYFPTKQHFNLKALALEVHFQ